MVEEGFEIWHSEMLQIDLILLLFDNYYFTMVEENFEIWFSETLQIGLILLLFDDNYFTMVEENLEIWSSEKHLTFWYFLSTITSSWLKN